MDIKQAEIRMLPLSVLEPNEGQLEGMGVHANPRQISEGEYKRLVESMRKDNLTGILQEKVFPFEEKFVVLDGNMRLRAMREIGVQEVACCVVPVGTPAEVLEKIIILSNSTFGEWDFDALANWDAPLADWGVELPEIDIDTDRQ